MTILGIDLGPSLTGVAISQGNIAEPLTTIKSKNLSALIEKISQILKAENAKKIIVGKLEGKNKLFYDEFQIRLKEANPQIELVEQDETLTTRQARETMIKLQVPKKKKKGKEHQIAACLILQSHLDLNA